MMGKGNKKRKRKRGGEERKIPSSFKFDFFSERESSFSLEL